MIHEQPNNEKTNPFLNPAYLICLSSHIQTLSQMYQQEKFPPLNTEYKRFLQSTFKNLATSLNVFSEDQTMLISSLISTKVELEGYVGQKLYDLLQKRGKPLAQIVKFILNGYQNNINDFQQLLIREKKRKIEFQQDKNDHVINNLKKQVIIKRGYIKDLEDRIKDLEQQNSKIYQKIIDSAKNTIFSTLVQSKSLIQEQESATPGRFSKMSFFQPNQNSPMQVKFSHKQMSLRQVYETILDIFQMKKKQQTISRKRGSMKSYIKHYFLYKFGLSELCEQTKVNFLSAVKHFLTSTWDSSEKGYGKNCNKIGRSVEQQRPLLLVFQKILDEEIHEFYFWNEYLQKGLKAINLFKRYFKEKEKIQSKELDRLYDGFEGISGSISNFSNNKIIFNQQERTDFQLDESDIKHILCNFYSKSKEVETLQMIFAELIGKEENEQINHWIGKGENPILSRLKPVESSKVTVFSKHLLGIILCYEIQLCSIRLKPFVNAIRKYSDFSEGAVINQNNFQKIILELNISQQKYLPYFQQKYQSFKDRLLSFSEVVQIIETEIIGERQQSKFNLGLNDNLRKQ